MSAPDREPLKRLILDHLDEHDESRSVSQIVRGLLAAHPGSAAVPGAGPRVSIHDDSVRLALYELIDTGEVLVHQVGDRRRYRTGDEPGGRRRRSHAALRAL